MTKISPLLLTIIFFFLSIQTTFSDYCPTNKDFILQVGSYKAQIEKNQEDGVLLVQKSDEFIEKYKYNKDVLIALQERASSIFEEFRYEEDWERWFIFSYIVSKSELYLREIHKEDVNKHLNEDYIQTVTELFKYLRENNISETKTISTKNFYDKYEDALKGDTSHLGNEDILSVDFKILFVKKLPNNQVIIGFNSTAKETTDVTGIINNLEECKSVSLINEDNRWLLDDFYQEKISGYYSIR